MAISLRRSPSAHERVPSRPLLWPSRGRSTEEEHLGGGYIIESDGDADRAPLRARLDHSASAPLSVSGVGPRHLLLSTTHPDALTRGRTVDVRLFSDDTLISPFRAQVAAIERDLDSSRANILLSLAKLPLNTGQMFYSLVEQVRERGLANPSASRNVRPAPAFKEKIEEQDRVKAVLRSLIANRVAGTLITANGERVTLQPAAPQAERILPLRWQLDRQLAERPVQIVLNGLNSTFSFDVGQSATVGRELATGLPGAIARHRQRVYRRATAPEGLDVVFYHPMWQHLEIRRPVRDISEFGLSFWSFPAADLVMPGLELPSIAVYHHDIFVAELFAEVRQVSQPNVGDDAVAGLYVRPRTDEDTIHWVDLVQNTLHPTTRTGGTPIEDTWSLYEDSGYFNLSDTSPDEFATLHDAFGEATTRIDAAPDLGGQFVYPSPRGIEGSTSALRIYHGTYFPGMLAKRKRSPVPLDHHVSSRDVLRDMHLRTYEHLLHDPDFRWIVVFLHDSVRWTKMAYRDFPSQFTDTGLVYQAPFQAFLSSVDAPPALSDTTVVVGPSEPAEISQLLCEIPAMRSPAYADALDLVPPRWNMRQISERWHDAGLQRVRAFLTARRAGVPIAIAVLETSSQGTHLFNMFDTVRTYSLSPFGYKDGATGFPALLLRARDWFRHHGTNRFVHLVEEGEPRYAEQLGLRTLGGANLLVMSSKLIPDFLECVYEITAPRDVEL